MPDYIYLLEHRLSGDQQSALRTLREVAREAEMILFLTGDAVRDLTSGHAVRDLEVAVHGNALNLKKAIENAGGKIWGEDQGSQSLYLCFPGTVRVDLVSTHRVEYPKPGQPVFHPGSIQEDLRRRDFTVNAMAISLNEGSFGLLMDPLNGAADIEARALRLVSNYGFLEDPSLLIRAARYRTRLGWDLDPKTQTRYDNAREEGVIEFLSSTARSRELEQIGHEDDGLKVLQTLETEGWMNVLFPQWSVSKADEEKLKALHDFSVELVMQGVHADVSAAQMQLLTAKLAPKDLGTLKKQMLRSGFVEEWNSLDALAEGFKKVLLSKENQTPSALFKLFTSYDPEAVLWLGFTSKESAVKSRYDQFLKVWPEIRQRVPYALMQEMRIRPELPNYQEIVHSIFLELIDGRLSTPEEMRAFLEPHSPPAPPPQVTIKRTRAKRGAEAKVKETFDDDEDSDDADSDEDLDDMGGDDDEIGIGLGLPKVSLEPDGEESLDVEEPEEAGEEDEDEADDDKPEPPPSKRGGKGSKPSPAAQHKSERHETSKTHVESHPARAVAKPAAPAAVAKAPVKPAHAPVPAKSAPVASHKKEAHPAHAAKHPPAAAKKATLKAAPKPAHKAVAKAPVKAHAKPAPAKAKHEVHPKPKPHAASKAPAKKVAAKASKKH